MKVTGCIFLLSLISYIISAQTQFSLFKENGKTGLKDQQGETLIPAQYEALGWSNGSFSVIDRVTGYQLHGRWGLINLSNHQVTTADFTGLVPGEGLLLIAYKNINGSLRNTAGCLTTSGKEIIPFQYDGLKVSSFRVIAFNRSGNQFRHGLLDLNNKTLIPLEYQSIHSIGSLRFAVENFNHKTALFTEAGDRITDFVIDSLSAFHKNYAVIYQNLHQGLIDRDGQLKIESKYRSIEIQGDGTIQAREPDEWFFLDAQNNELQKIKADSIEGVELNIFKRQIAGETQLVDGQFKLISTLTFSFLGKFKNEKAIFGREKKYGMIRKNGEIIIQPVFDGLLVEKNYYIGNQRKNGKDQWALLDSLGNKRTTKPYDLINAFNGKFYPAKSHNFWGALDENGKEIIACVHDSLMQSVGENLVVKFHGQYGIIDIHENWLVTPQPNLIKLIRDDLYLEYANQTTFLKSLDKNIIYFTDNKFEVHPDYLIEYLPSGALWKIDFQGRIVSRQINPKEHIEKIFPESEGLRGIKKDGRFGFVDSRGRLRIANRYEDIQAFNGNLAAVKILGKWGFINHEDKIAIQPVYEEVTSFQSGVAIVKQKSLFGAVDKSGRLILPVRYQALQILPSQRLLITQDEQQGLADGNGKSIINPKFTAITDLNNGFVIVQRNQKYGLLTLQGISTIPMIYDFISYDEFNKHYIALKKSEWTIIKP